MRSLTTIRLATITNGVAPVGNRRPPMFAVNG